MVASPGRAVLENMTIQMYSKVVKVASGAEICRISKLVGETDLQKSLSACSQSDRRFSWNWLVWQPRVR